MPKVVDRDERRREVAGALWQVAYRDGWDAVSMRKVAAKAGLSLGSVQHYFSGIDDLLDYAVLGVLDVLDDRLIGQLADLNQDGGNEHSVRAVLHEMIPGIAANQQRLGEGRSEGPALHRLQMLAWLALVTRATRRPELQSRLSGGSRKLAGGISEVLQHHHPVRPALRNERAAAGMLALTEGLILQLARNDITIRDAAAIIDQTVHEAFSE